MEYQNKPLPKHLNLKYHYTLDTNGILTKIHKGKKRNIRGSMCNNKLAFAMATKDGKTKRMDAATLVATMYLDNPANCKMAELIDPTDGTNIGVDNLKWKAVIGNLTDEQVHGICLMLATPSTSTSDILRKYPMLSHTNVYDINNGKIYTTIGKQYGLGNGYDTLTRLCDVNTICRLLEQGISEAEIASKLKDSVSIEDIVAIRNGTKYAQISKNYIFASSTDADSLGNNGLPSIDPTLAEPHKTPTPGDNRVLDIESVVEESEEILNKLLGLLEPTMLNTKARIHSPSSHQQLVKLHDSVLTAWKDSLLV